MKREEGKIPLFLIFHFGIFQFGINNGEVMNNIYSQEHISIIKKLKKAREESGLSQLQAAKLLKKTQSYISKLESGQRHVNVIQLKEFARIYKREIKYFL